MTKKGRKAKPGKRYKSGRLTRAARADDARETVTEARMRLLNVTKAAALDPDMGFPLGRLFKGELVSKAQYAAGNRFTEVLRGYMLSKGIGAPTVPAQDPNRRGASLTERPVQYEDEAIAFIEALADVDRANPSVRTATSLVWDICLREESEHMAPRDMGLLREGLNSVARVIQRRESLSKKAA